MPNYLRIAINKRLEIGETNGISFSAM